MTFKVLTDDTQKVLCRSNIGSALNFATPNLRLDTIDGEWLRQYVKFRDDSPRETNMSDEDHR
jgi:hypothetical protein